MSEDMDEEKDECEDESEEQHGDGWKEYKESMKEWKDQYKAILSDWKDRFHDWRNKVEANVSKVSVSDFSFPPVPPIPPIPPMHSISVGRANVVASRIGDEELRLIDMLIEAGIFNTRSEAVAYLVSEGIKARRDTFEKVSTSLEEIRKTRKEAEKQVEKLKEEIGLKESRVSEETDKQHRVCPRCGKKLSDLPDDIVVCPFCGRKLADDE
jgi:rubrerythrin